MVPPRRRNLALAAFAIFTFIGCVASDTNAPNVVSPEPADTSSQCAEAAIAVRPERSTLALNRGLPLVAIWKEQGLLSNGVLMSSGEPALRVAVWEDGYVVHSADPSKWEYSLKSALISQSAVNGLKARLASSGIMGLRNHCVTVEDGSVVCTLVNAGPARRILYGDDTVRANRAPGRAAFDEFWEQIRITALDAIPSDSVAINATFPKPPRDWYIEPRIRRE